MDERKTATIQIRLTKSEKLALERDAKKHGFDRKTDFILFLYRRYGKGKKLK